MIDWLLVQVTICPPEKSERVLVVWWYSNLMEHAFKDLVVDVMSSGVDREWQRRRRFHSEDTLDTLRLKNSRAGYLSRITKLYRETAELLMTQRMSMKFRRNFWTLTKPLLASRRRITITFPLYLGT